MKNIYSFYRKPNKHLSVAIILSEILGTLFLVVLLAALIGIAGFMYRPLGI